MQFYNSYNIIIHFSSERRTQDGFLSKKSPKDDESVQCSDTSQKKGTTQHVYVNSPVQGLLHPLSFLLSAYVWMNTIRHSLL